VTLVSSSPGPKRFRNIRVPTLYQDDLHAFRTRHFPGRTREPILTDSSVIIPDEERTNDDGLGYYPDGVKRTLTDQQIEIFRHSEIQRLLRGRRLNKEARLQEVDDESTEHSPDAISAAKTACEQQRHENPQYLGKRVQQGEIEHGGSGTVGRVMLVESNSGSASPPHY
jgi:hypothetical protein